ncbi:hypothetical protein ACFV0Y_31450 [Streptomyces sp. NPDC059569]|uniref:hypothetical protein n=1 Tax=Streptomyces sp. NPDC059569 TaxID=3346869 RepID=UPI0036986F63
MPHVRAHRRKDGTYVRAHRRRARPRSAAQTSTTYRTPPRRNVTYLVPVQPGTMTRVRRYQRADGTTVRSHNRALPTRTVVRGGIGFGGAVAFIWVLLALFGGGAEQSTSGNGTAPTPAASATTSR